MDAETLQEIAVTYMDDASPQGKVIRKLAAEVELNWQARAVQVQRIAAQAQEITERMAELKRLRDAMAKALAEEHSEQCWLNDGGFCDCDLPQRIEVILRETLG